MRIIDRLDRAARALARDLAALRKNPAKFRVQIMVAEARLSAVSSARRAWRAALTQLRYSSPSERRRVARGLGIPVTARERREAIDRIQREVLARLGREQQEHAQ